MPGINMNPSFGNGMMRSMGPSPNMGMNGGMSYNRFQRPVMGGPMNGGMVQPSGQGISPTIVQPPSWYGGGSGNPPPNEVTRGTGSTLPPGAKTMGGGNYPTMDTMTPPAYTAPNPNPQSGLWNRFNGMAGMRGRM